MATLPKDMVEAAPLGSWLNPIQVDGPLVKYPDKFKDRPYIYAVPKGGTMTKWYRSYSDYCD